MNTHTPRHRLTSRVITGISVSLLVAGFARADNDATQIPPINTSQPTANVAVAQPRQQQAGIQAIGKARDLITKQDLKAATAKTASEKGDLQTAKQSLEAALVSIQYSEIDLPLTSTQGFVHQAAAALQKNDAKTADKARQSAEQGVILSTAVDQPLYYQPRREGSPSRTGTDPTLLRQGHAGGRRILD